MCSIDPGQHGFALVKRADSRPFLPSETKTAGVEGHWGDQCSFSIRTDFARSTTHNTW